MSPAATPSELKLSPELAELKDRLVQWLELIQAPASPTTDGWADYIEPMRSEPWSLADQTFDSLKLNLYTAENRYLMLVRPEKKAYSLTVYVLSRRPFKDEMPFNEDSFISGGEFSKETLIGCLLAILERELIARV
ncbi:MAG: hypothetical protein RBT76_14330 [candidate division Zixibacteria bacterium]|nr:hypothetical protein [candidate division Zixibacteria bacterium]